MRGIISFIECKGSPTVALRVMPLPLHSGKCERCLPVLLLLMAAFSLAACERKEEAAPNIDALKDILVRSAEEKLGSETVTDDRVVLVVPRETRQARAEEISTIATEIGGAALRSDQEDGSIHLLIQLPAGTATEFLNRIGKARPAGTAPGEEAVWLDVLLAEPE